ncbi:phage major capsid protein, HK97 family [Alkalithermobacter thermoalcaliphilus JW-YL-7 = DSM 7308]|uniref:Phage major capsid protein, HK97 family n=1 Tax=Alkalithermobacter thermoalcaliphilus JW-YL-7 = DSM 7308 TaxID=1121328 RepID=A0A150FQY6_CLOPD|nr:phage major capsid protein, HK97 family [[Clostridium] paradoxum JW-YL-7 = DSM 7308]SHL13553.1 phage major capsid protein, HK97 family [[Clostridium] paradoxum JW-YL-7 = DSM 7308]
MTKELREVYAKLEETQTQAKALLEKENVTSDEINAKTEEIKALKAKITALEEMENQMKEDTGGVIPMNQITEVKDHVKEFINAARNRFRNAMSVGSNQDGGYTVPEDIQTKVNEFRTSKDALQNLITVEKVTAPTGERTFKTRAQQTGFVEVSEGGDIPEKTTPQFTRLPYAVKKYAGFMKVTNELLKDSDEAIQNLLVRWIGDESRVTRNKLILAALGTKSKTAIASTDDIKDILNVQLDPAFRYTSLIVTNQDGFNWLDKLKDEDGNYLLQPSVSAPTGKQLFGVPVVMVSNKDLPTNEGKAPMIIGDLKEAVVMFEREGITIAASDVAGDAYLTDITLFRAIEREDVKIKDAEAYVYGEIALS